MSELQDLGNLPFTALSATMLYRLLGESAVYLGGKNKEWTQKTVENIERVFRNAYKKLGDCSPATGSVPPRVLRGTVNEAAYCEDDVAAEYLGGVLASSRDQGSRDDRGVVMNALISRMSVYQLRTHYICYFAAWDLYQGTDTQFDVQIHGIKVPFLNYLIAMDFGQNEYKEWSDGSDPDFLHSILEHTFHGLHKEGLLTDFEYGQDSDEGITVMPSALGIELFMWAHGIGPLGIRRFLDKSLNIERLPDVRLFRNRTLAVDNEKDTPLELGWIDGFTYALDWSGRVCQLTKHVEDPPRFPPA